MRSRSRRQPAMKAMLGKLLLGAGLLAGATVEAATEPPTPKRPNVLFIMADDLNHWVGYTGRNRQTLTPNLDRLAAGAVSFTRSNCAAPLCNPSRTALFSGLRPGTTGIYSNSQDWRPEVPVGRTMFTALRQGGYEVLVAGKIYHGNLVRREEFDGMLDQLGVPRTYVQRPPVKGEALKFGHLGAGVLAGGDEMMPDWAIANYGIEQLGKVHDQPFFLGIGLLKPHSPLVVPRKYFDLHPLADIELPPYLKDDLADIPPPGVKRANGNHTHDEIVKAGKWKEMIQAYLACVSFVDAQVGRILAALEHSPYRDNTIVVFMGDHGWALGEKDHWAKLALWEEEARAPLIWKVPGLTPAGARCGRTVDFMGIYPTVMELCGLPIPAHVEGVSFKRLLADPAAPWDRPAVTTNGPGEHAVRSERWRYIRYATGEEELYDETKDPYEWTNLAANPEWTAVKKDLAAWLPANSRVPAGGRLKGNEEDEDAAINQGVRRARRLQSGP